MLLKMAIRNVARHKRRTFLTVITMAVGLMFFIFFDSLFVGIDRMVVEGLVKYSDSSIIIYSKEYDENKKAYPLKKGIKDVDRIFKLAQSFKDVEEVATRTQFLGELVYYGKSKYIIGKVINPELDERVFEIKDSIKEGKYFSDGENEAIIGIDLAKELGITVGETITIIAQTKYETYNALDFVVSGLISTTIPSINEASLILTYRGAEKLLDLEGSITSIHIKVKWPKGESIPSYTKRVANIANSLQKDLPEYKVYNFMDIYGEFLLLMQQKKATTFIITFLILLIAAVGIVNTILMAVYERIKEIGVLLAMGFKPKEIRKLFLLEGMVIGVIGGLSGVLLGVLADLWLIYSGYNLEAIFSTAASGIKASEIGMPVWGVIYGEWNFGAFVLSFCFGLTVALISAYIPARYASKLEVTNCLRFV